MKEGERFDVYISPAGVILLLRAFTFESVKGKSPAGKTGRGDEEAIRRIKDLVEENSRTINQYINLVLKKHIER